MPEEGEVVLMRTIRDNIIAVLEAHEKECGDPNCQFKANAIAYFCHTVGLQESDLPKVAEYINDYNMECPNKQAGHFCRN